MRVKYMAYAGAIQENCLRLMGKKLLVSLAMEGNSPTTACRRRTTTMTC